MPDRTSPLAPFRHGTFRAIWIANLASSFGALIQAVGAAWMMTTISDSAGMIALVQASTALPVMLFSLAAGAVADSFHRRQVMLVAQIFMLAVSALLTLFAYLELVTPWLLLAFTFLIGCGMALNNPSWQASVGDIVPRDDLPGAVTLNSMGFNLTRSVGPAVGGVIVAAAGAAAAFAVNTVSYLALIVVLSRWRPQIAPRTLPREPFGSAMGAGLRYVAMSPNIGKVLLRSLAFGLATSAILALLPLITRDLLLGGPLVYGAMLGAFGMGAVGGALSSGWLRDVLSSEAIVRWAFTGFAVCASTAALSPNPWLTAMALMLGGACWVTALSLFNVTVQLSAPRWVVGRALSIYQTATFGGIAAGSWIWGLVAEQNGVQTALLASGAAMIAGAALGFLYALPEQTALNLDPLNRWTEPPLALDITPRSGPIAIMIEYVIKEEDVPAFLEAMRDRRRMRMRDGARNWTLLRDLEKPQMWMEKYHLPTWLEYVRHNLRSTLADATIGERIRALHSGPERPRVHRMIERQTSRPSAEPAPKGMIDLH